MSQTSISATGQAVGIAGQLYDNAEVVDIVSAFNEEASAELAFGRGVIQGTAADSAKLPTAETDKFKGVVVHSFNHMVGTNGDLGTTGVKAAGGLQLIRKGRVIVEVDAGITSIVPYSDRGFLRAVSDGSANTVVGRFAKADDSTNTIDTSPQVLFVSGLLTLADGSKGAVVELDLTSKQLT